MGNCIIVTSGKGGVGKTTCSANISYYLARMGKKILCIDFDTGLRNLDLLLGLEDNCVFDLYDILSGNVKCETGIIAHPEVENLFFIPAPLAKKELDYEKLKDFVIDLKNDYDYIIIDCPAGIGKEFEVASSCADMAIMITTPDILSVRDVTVTSDLLYEKGIEHTYLVVNRIVAKNIKKYDGYFINIDEIIDKTATRLLGMVGEDRCLYTYLREDTGKRENSLCGICYSNIAKRILGEKVPLFRFWTKRKYK